MTRRIALLLAALLAGTALAKTPSGVVLDFRAGAAVELVGVSTAEQVDSRPFRDGPTWTIALESPSGNASWTNRLPVPRAFHADTEEDLHFSLVVPRPAPGSHLVLRSERGDVLWTRTVDAGLIAQADREGAHVRRELAGAYAATAKLRQSVSAQSGYARAPRTEVADPPRPPEITNAPVTRTKPAALKDDAEPTFAVSGHVDVDHPIIVRAYAADGGRFVLSTQQDPKSGLFEMPLPAGRYVFEADDNLMNFERTLFYRTPIRTGALQVSADTTLPDIAVDPSSGAFVLSAELPCPRQPPPLAHFTVVATSADGARIERLIPAASATPTDAAGNCIAQYRLRLSPGTYTIEGAPLGWNSKRYAAVRITADAQVEQTEIFSAAARSLVWRGQLVSETGQPIAGRLHWHDGMLLGEKTLETSTDANGRFETPYHKGWTAQFFPDDRAEYDAKASTRVTIGEEPPPATVVLPELAFQSLDEGGLLRLYGDGNRKTRFNILIVGDGYAAAHESYTDLNGNGQWDGFAWQDLDRNGVVSDGDFVTAYGSPTPAVLPNGANPADFSEPFTDLNGDGVLSIDDGAIFHRGAREFTRALLGADLWNEHRDAFNVYELFEPSEQAGYSVMAESGERVIERRTRYDTVLRLKRFILATDREELEHRALAALPELDLVVLLINRPVMDIARGNSSLTQPGSILWTAGAQTDWSFETGPAHEMGHFVGGLCDEYTEFFGVHPEAGNPIAWCANVGFVPEFLDLPWMSWLANDTRIPSRDMVPSLGVYEGAEYYPGGAFRPNFNSIMRNNRLSPLFNPPSRTALERAIARRTNPAVPPRSPRPLPPLFPRRD